MTDDDSVILPYNGLAVVREFDEETTSLGIETVLAVRIPLDTSGWTERVVYTLEGGWLSNVIDLATPADIERVALWHAALIAKFGQHLGSVEGCEPWVMPDKFDDAWWPAPDDVPDDDEQS